MENLEIRPCINEDYKFVFELLKQLWLEMELDNEALYISYKKALDSDNQFLIVGIVDKIIIGFCSLTIKNNLWQAGNIGHIDELIVETSIRNKGIGEKLMSEITKIAKENNCKRIELDSAFHRKAAHQFYENLGYENRAYLFSKKIETTPPKEKTAFGSKTFC
ncbi:MAG: GNAT family N-acetyltransferase [Tannerellaceae bacterium]|jgi:ribosomal protein S18 acetylase RimI-like enzyme|nr:GNAT family N-acetyltransferase [Tannerellaceae bacterium]